MTFSIIVPVYNAAHYLRVCLDSFVAQDYADWEAVCVDDGSKDESGKILDEYAARDKRFVVIHKVNEGVSVARNVAMARARGEWLLFADADDAYVPGAFSVLKKLIDAHDFDGGFCSTYQPLGDKLPSGVTGSGKVLYASHEPENGKNLLFLERRLLGYPWLRIFRASLFKDVLFPCGVPMCEDMIQLVGCLAKKARWARFDLQVYAYRLNTPGSASKIGDAVWCARTLEAYNRIIREAEKNCSLILTERQVYAKQSASPYSTYVRSAFKNPKASGITRVVDAAEEYLRLAGARALDFGVRLRLMSVRRKYGGWAYRMIALYDWFYLRIRNHLGDLLKHAL